MIYTLYNMKPKRYLKNLLRALLGHNPFRQELEEQHRLRREAEAKVQAQDIVLREIKRCVKKAERQVLDYQSLTENLRQRITDKDMTLDQQKRDYNQAIGTMREQHRLQREKLEQKNQELREDLEATLEQLQKANNTIGKDIMAQSLLDKTNNGLEDLYAAMQRGDTEAMMEVTQGLDWSNHLTRIAQQHLMVLKRKNELEARLYERRFDTE